jgi:cardiolipin synthase (CMP-forming)
MRLRIELTVPNILTFIRFMAIPVLAYLIDAGDAYNTMAFVLFVAIWMTDMLDGYIARRFKQISEFGKLFDPLVDKLFQFTTAVMMFIVGRLPLWVPLFIFIKEILMIIGSAVLFRKTKLVVFAEWYGKIGTVLFVAAFAALFFLPRDQTRLASYIFIIPVAWSLYAYFRYGFHYVWPLLTKKRPSDG